MRSDWAENLKQRKDTDMKLSEAIQNEIDAMHAAPDEVSPLLQPIEDASRPRWVVAE